MTACFHQTVSEPQKLSEFEWHKMLVEWNNTTADYPKNACVHEMIEAQVRRTPEIIAVECEGRELKYELLNNRANQLAHHLRKLGASPDKLVGVCVERSIEMVVALLGTLKSGAAYVPLDPHFPLDRLTWMMKDSGLKTLITTDSLKLKFPDYTGERISMDSQAPILSRESVDNIPHTAEAENLAYVIYTSGSTGRPKGVQISHRNLVNLLISMQSKPGLNAHDKLLAVTTISFDIAALELYLPLITGARIILATREVATDGRKLQRKLETAGISVMQATPATWRLLLEAGWQGGCNLKVLCGGEPMPRELANALLKRSSSVWNMYGPTETTVWSTISQMTQCEDPVSVGRPIANTQVFVLDSQRHPVPVGATGELYIGGEGVARGYLNRPDLTAEKFIANPFSEKQSGIRLYRTGDLARYLPNGEIECLGRIDNQVKIRGYRIELGEIESVLNGHPSVRQSVIAVCGDDVSEKRLVAYVVAEPGSTPLVEELRTFAKLKLPEYMVPTQFEFLEAFPLTPNGKVNRKALPSPSNLDTLGRIEYLAPRDNVELRLVKIWQSVLGIRGLSVKDNFFDLGGNSLLVARLITQIDRSFRRRLSTASVVLAPTIQQQAAIIRSEVASSRPSAVFPVQPSGSKSPFFCCGFHAGALFVPLARRLGPDQPFLSIDPTLLDPMLPATVRTMEEIAACLVKQVRQIQRDGPYYLGGFCAGGLMAYEMARQLTEDGQQVGLLALFEPQTPADYNTSSAFWIDSVAKKMRFHVQRLLQLELEEARLYVLDRTRTLIRYLERLASHGVWTGRSRLNGNRPHILEDTLAVAYSNYQPRPFAVRMALFQALNRLPGSEQDRQYWSNLVGTLQIHELPGFSNWVLRFFVEPNVQILASILAGYLAPAMQLDV
jgi:amino acid adenylation domain-containing protein